MIVLASILTAITIATCISRCKYTYNYIKFKRSKSYKNFVISDADIGDYKIVYYMCKGKMYSYFHHKEDEHFYTETPPVSDKDASDKYIAFATFITPTNNNLQIVTKKMRKFAGLDGTFYNWTRVPGHIKRKILKAPKESTGIRIIYGNGEYDTLSLSKNDD